MSMFTMLPIASGDSSLPMVSRADIRLLPGGPAPYAHWIFDIQNAGALIAFGGKVLTPKDAATQPAFHANYMESPGSIATAVQSDFHANGQHTIIAVLREHSTATAVKIMFGDLLGATTTPEKGASVFASGSGAARDWRMTATNITTLQGTGCLVTAGSFQFVGMSVDAANHIARLKVGGYAVIEKSEKPSSPAWVASTDPVTIGPTSWNGGTGAGIVDIAEFLIFDEPLSVAELEAEYSASQARMAARGITI